jgi:DNA polymerase III epsilon subunit-like protein
MEQVAKLLAGTSFAIVDVETTGFSPIRGDRIVEVAVVRIGPAATKEYSTLVNPLRDVGPTYIHGITAEDVAQAPMFSEIVGDLLEMLDGAIMVAHNIRFDRSFLSAEFSAAGLFLPEIPCLCTLEMAYRLEPALLNHKLATCCAAVGVFFQPSHSALGDARAEADLLRRFLVLAEAQGAATLEALGCKPILFPTATWPHLHGSGRHLLRLKDGHRGELPYLARMVASLGLVTVSEKLAPYMNLLDRVLEDEQVTEGEADALQAIAQEWGLSMEDVLTAHQCYLESLVTAAVEDGQVTSVELHHLEMATRLLAIDPAVMHALVAEGMKDPG